MYINQATNWYHLYHGLLWNIKGNVFKWKVSKKLLSKNKVAKEEMRTYVLKVKPEQADN